MFVPLRQTGQAGNFHEFAKQIDSRNLLSGDVRRCSLGSLEICIRVINLQDSMISNATDCCVIFSKLRRLVLVFVRNHRNQGLINIWGLCIIRFDVRNYWTFRSRKKKRRLYYRYGNVTSRQESNFAIMYNKRISSTGAELISTLPRNNPMFLLDRFSEANHFKTRKNVMPSNKLPSHLCIPRAWSMRKNSSKVDERDGRDGPFISNSQERASLPRELITREMSACYSHIAIVFNRHI